MLKDAVIEEAPPGEDEQLIAIEPTQAEWEEVYRLCRLSEAGITLEQFRATPWDCLRAQGQELAVACMRKGFLPLLPEQAAIAAFLRDEEGSGHGW